MAFTIELDNEWERQLLESKRPRIFLLSLVMWANYLRFIPTGGIPADELEALAQHKVDLNGLTRWRYATVNPPEAGKAPKRQWIVRLTEDGAFAQGLWEPLPDLIEQRWRERYGMKEIKDLEIALQLLIDRFDNRPTPLYLPDVTSRNEMFTLVPTATEPIPLPDSPLFALLSRVLLELTLEFEADSGFALPIAANTLRVLDREPTALRDLPELAGVSKEGTVQALTVLDRHKLAIVEQIPNERGRQIRLTPEGVISQAAYHQRSTEVETAWRSRFGEGSVSVLSDALRALVGNEDSLAGSPLAAAVDPPPRVWRASRPAPGLLPHHPMVIGRGGWPDAS